MDRIIKTFFPEIQHHSRIYHALKWMGLVVGCMAKFVTGSLFVFNVYQDDMKETFNYTQREVELQSSLINLGLGFGFFPGLFYDRFGPTWTSLLGVLISIISYGLLWSTSKNIAFYSRNSWLSAIYFFLTGFGSVFTYMVALNTNIINFEAKHRSKVVGLMNAFFAGSPSIFSIIYYRVIQTSNSGRSFGSLMLLFAISFGFTDVVCMLFLRLYAQAKESSTEYLPGSDENDAHKEISDIPIRSDTHRCIENDTNLKQHLSMRELFQQIDYWLFLGLFCFASLVGLVFLNNLTVITKSNGLSSHDEDIVLIIPVTDAIVSAGTGLLSDLLKDKIPRVFLLVIACASFTGCTILAMIWGHNYVILCIATFLCGSGIGIVWTLCPTVISEMLYVGDIGRNWGIALLVGSLLGWAVQEAFGSLYDHETPPGSINCTSGMNCVRIGLLILVICGAMSTVCGIALLLKRNIRRCCNCYSDFT